MHLRAGVPGCGKRKEEGRTGEGIGSLLPTAVLRILFQPVVQGNYVERPTPAPGIVNLLVEGDKMNDWELNHNSWKVGSRKSAALVASQ